MSAAKKTYEIYVTDAKGWDQECDSAKNIFFAPNESETYIHMDEGGHQTAGSLLIVGHREAAARLRNLRSTGDWGVHEGHQRPKYAMREASFDNFRYFAAKA